MVSGRVRMKIAIIGAGIAGLSAAALLAAAGHEVKLFDKGRGPGGRLSTRRVRLPEGDVSFDHGAQYFTARSASFSAAVAGWVSDGVVAGWAPRMTAELNGPAFVGVAGMSSLVRHLASPFDVNWATQVEAIVGEAPGLELALEGGARAGPFERVVVAVPAEQAAVLLQTAAPGLAEGARSVVSSPCWAVLLAYHASAGIEWDARQVPEGPIAWMARNSSKPGRAGPETWVLHASPEWSREHLESAPGEVSDALTQTFRELTNAGPPIYAAAHRWRYARVETPLGTAFQHNPRLGIGTCGDWHLGARVEAAWLSGAGLAEEMLH